MSTNEACVEKIALNGVNVYVRHQSDLMHRGQTESGYDGSYLTCSIREPDAGDAERVLLHEFLHALLWTDPLRLVPAGHEQHEAFVKMLTAGLHDTLGYRRVPLPARACARCTSPTESPTGRFCATHRREHGEHLTQQLNDVLVEHKAAVTAARIRAAAVMAETCGHPSERLVEVDGLYRCGGCIDALVDGA